MQTFAPIPRNAAAELARHYLEQARLLLTIVAIRTAPATLGELSAGSNTRTKNAAYLHPDALAKLGLNPATGVRIDRGSLIVCTQLLPPFGVIYGPLFDLFLNFDQDPAAFEKDWNVARLHRPGKSPYLTPGDEAVKLLGDLLPPNEAR